MQAILDQLPLEDDIKAALIDQHGSAGVALNVPSPVIDANYRKFNTC